LRCARFLFIDGICDFRTVIPAKAGNPVALTSPTTQRFNV
jgi:hypothetical protein